MTKACAKHDILHWVCSMAGCTQLEMAEACAQDQTVYWQIYAKSDIHETEQEVKLAVQRGFKGFALTVDAIRPGKRERDIRHGIEEFEDVSVSPCFKPLDRTSNEHLKSAQRMSKTTRKALA